ncbi:hypothetical protein SGLAM104S_01551 [Streptomyces glaucescens]
MTERHIIKGTPRSDRDVFEYALLRVVPRIERGECINAGVLVYCRAKACVAPAPTSTRRGCWRWTRGPTWPANGPRCGPSRGSAHLAVTRRARQRATTPGAATAG